MSRAAGAAPAGGDRGSGTVLVLGLAALIVALTWLVAVAGAVAVIRHRAEAAADLAALAAASGPWGAGPADCTRAARVARVNGGLLVGCRVLADESVEVRVAVVLDFPGASGATVRARGGARAGRPPPGRWEPSAWLPGR